MVLLKASLVIALVALLLRVKFPFSPAVLLSAVVMGLGFNLSFEGMGLAAWNVLQSEDTLRIAAIVGVILVLAEMLQASGQLLELSRLTLKVFGKRKVTYTIMPALVGLLPMPGGALFSAPLLDTVSNDVVPPHKKTVINYWFRHIWEYFWPLYTGLVIAAAIFKVDVYQLSSVQMLLTAVSVAAGMAVVFPGIKDPEVEPSAEKAGVGTVMRMVYCLMPIAIIIILFVVTPLPMAVCLLTGLAWAMATALGTKALTFEQTVRIVFLKASVYKMLLTVASILVFSGVLQASTLTAELEGFFKSGGSVPEGYVVAIAAALPLIVGMLTGMTVAFVGTTFPIIYSIAPHGPAILPIAMVAYASGMVGVMLSPLHLCLILTNQYYGSKLADVYKLLIPICAVVMASAGAMYAALKIAGWA